MMKALQHYDFTWLRTYDPDWESQVSINPEKYKAFTASLFHYNMDVSMVMRYASNNYTGKYRDVQAVVSRIQHIVNPDLLTDYVAAMTIGCPWHFVAETTRENALLYWRKRNSNNVSKNLEQVVQTMNKEEKKNYVIPLPHWLARYIPHIFFTPQDLVEKPGGKDRGIFNAAK